jgi:hypothetical protein
MLDVLATWLTVRKNNMTFDQWIDAVNAAVHNRLGNRVRTEELSWDSAMWVSTTGTAVASLADEDASTAKLYFDGGDKMSLAFQQPEGAPEIVSATIAARLGR